MTKFQSFWFSMPVLQRLSIYVALAGAVGYLTGCAVFIGTNNVDTSSPKTLVGTNKVTEVKVKLSP